MAEKGERRVEVGEDRIVLAPGQSMSNRDMSQDACKLQWLFVAGPASGVSRYTDWNDDDQDLTPLDISVGDKISFLDPDDRGCQVFTNGGSEDAIFEPVARTRRPDSAGAATKRAPIPIVISYRRAESGDVAGRIHDRLTAAFGPKSVFMDVDNIELGDDFREHIASAIDGCSVVIAVIGKEWLATRNADGGRRLDDEDDPVRIEIQYALERNVPTIPVLVGGASMPRPAALPAPLRGLSTKAGMAVRPNPDFNRDIADLIKSVKRRLKPE